MSAADVELITEMFETFNRGELEAAIESLHPEVELRQPENMVDAQTYSGVDGFVRGLTTWLGEWESMRYEVEQAVDAPQGVFLRVATPGTGRSSGLEVERRWFHVWRVRDGKAASCWIFAEEEPARVAAGLPQQ